jgi:hypothetical protein
LANTALAGWRFFHFGAHGVQIVSGRNHRKENDEQAPERQQAMEGISLPPLGCNSGIPPEAKGRHRQKQPEEIEQQFHYSEALGLEMNMT